MGTWSGVRLQGADFVCNAFVTEWHGTSHFSCRISLPWLGLGLDLLGLGLGLKQEKPPLLRVFVLGCEGQLVRDAVEGGGHSLKAFGLWFVGALS